MSRSVLCVDIGGTSTKFGLFGESERIQILESIPSRGPAGEFVQSLEAAISRAVGRHQVAGIGIAVAGFLSESRDRMVYNSNLPWLENVPLCDIVEKSFNLPVVIEADSNTATLAEFHLGSGRTSERFMCVTVGTGLGVGMIEKGEPLRFAYGCMGDPGHMVVQPNGPLCLCGGHGCAEVFVAAPLLAEEFRLRSGRETDCTLRDVIEAARENNAVAKSVLQHAGEWLGIACATLGNIFFPDRIAIAGGLAEAGDFVLDSVRVAFDYAASKFTRDRVAITRATLGAMATLTGAAYPILKHLQDCESHALRTR